MTPLDRPILFLATSDPERSRMFYERTLGLKFLADTPPALVFQIGGTTLRIQKVDRVRVAPYTAMGWAVADIRESVRELQKLGVAFETYVGMNQDADGIWQSPAGALVAWFKDPDGNILSLTQHS